MSTSRQSEHTEGSSRTESCRACDQATLEQVLQLGEHPIAHRLLTSPTEEEYVHPVDLRICQSCGLIQLVDPVPADMLYTQYNWLSAWKWNPHSSRLIDLIKQLPGLDSRSHIVEIASNDGSFLAELKRNGYERLLGVEPSRDGSSASQDKGIETVSAYFNRETAERVKEMYGAFDLLVVRHGLEHIADLRGFQEATATVLRPGGYALIEVPNADFSFSVADFSAIWEEHVNYFTEETLTSFMAGAGIEAFHSETATFSGQSLIVLGRHVGDLARAPSTGFLPGLRAKALLYRDRWPGFREEFVRYLDEHTKGGGKAAIYGAGCRANSLINFVGLGPYIEYMVDDQPEKQGMYMPESRLPILPSDVLAGGPVTLCLLAVNAENEKKVIARHAAFLERGGVFASILPPSDLLLPFFGSGAVGDDATRERAAARATVNMPPVERGS